MTEPPRGLDVVVLAASVGGLEALGHVLAALGPDFGAAVLIVQHLDPNHNSLMVPLLARRTRLPIATATSDVRLRTGAAWIAPPDYHMIVGDGGVLMLDHGPPVNHLRPAADPLLDSVARHYRERAIAVILSGSGRDGAAGVRAIKARGGTVLVQDRASSTNWGMPGAALATGCVDRVLPLDEIGPALIQLLLARPTR